MNRRDRDQFDRNDYGMYEGYNPQDEHYHSARNLTNEFEQDYQREHGHRNDDRDQYHPQRSYHEGNSMGDAYERRSRKTGSVRSDTSYDMIDQDRYRNYPDRLDRDRDRYSNYQDDYRSYQGMDRGRDREMRSNISQGNLRQGYGISSFEGTSDRFNTLNRDDNRSGESYYEGSGDSNRRSRTGGGMGEAFPHSHGGVPDYGTGNYGRGTGTGMGSTYGGSNYGAGTGYMSGHRGSSFGSSSYGSSSGNYEGYGSMGSGTYGGRGGTGGDTSHNSDRGTRDNLS